MNEREKDLSDIKSFIEETDKELTLLLQSLQWDRQHLLQGKSLVQCKYDPGHRIPEEIKEKHEEHCFYKTEGYEEEDELLPDPFDPSAKTLVKLSNTGIQEIVSAAKIADQYFKRGEGCQGEQPMSLARLQATYTPDERRAFHDAVVAAAPTCHDLSDLTLINEEKSGKTMPKTNLEILAELRDMKRRRMKYRVASKTRNYSDVLRDVIRSQLELYTGEKTQPIPVKPNFMQNECQIQPTDLRIEDPYGQTQQIRKRTKEVRVPDQKGKERKNRRGVNANYKFDDLKKHNDRNRNGKSLGDRVPRPNTSKEYRYQREGRHSFREREYVTSEKHRQERGKIHAGLKKNGNSSTGVERRYNTTEYRHEKDIRERGKSSREADKRRHSTHEEHNKEKDRRYEAERRGSGNAPREGEKKRHNTKEEYRHEKEKRYDEKSKNTGNSSREDERKPNTSEKHRHEKEKQYERESRDKTKEERSDKNKNYESHSHHDSKDKEEKCTRRDNHDDNSHSKKHKR